MSLVARSAAATLFAAPLTHPQEGAQRWPKERLSSTTNSGRVSVYGSFDAWHLALCSWCCIKSVHTGTLTLPGWYLVRQNHHLHVPGVVSWPYDDLTEYVPVRT